jgi:hypothetical protein
MTSADNFVVFLRLLFSNVEASDKAGAVQSVHVSTLPEGFSHFVASMTAPVASGWSRGRVGLAPTGKAPPFHGAHPLQLSYRSLPESEEDDGGNQDV